MEEGRHARCAGRPPASAGTRTACAGSGRGPRACRLRRLATVRRRHRGAAAARGHRRKTTRPEVGRVDRVHRSVRGRTAGRRQGPGVGLPRDHRLRGRPDRREGPEPVPDRSAAVRGGAGTRPGRSRERPGPGRTRQAAVRPRRQAGPQSRLCPDELRPAATGARGRRGERRGRAGRRGTGQAEPRVHADLGADRRAHLRPPGRHRQSGHRTRRCSPRSCRRARSISSST